MMQTQFALLLRCMPTYYENGLEKRWVGNGTGESRCINIKMIPLHRLYTNIGKSFSRIVLRAHILSSKIAALQSEPAKYLLAFGELEHPTYHDFLIFFDIRKD